MARKSEYEKKVKPHLEQIKNLIAVATEKEIADLLDISQQTFIKYKKEHEELAEAVKVGIPLTILRVKRALLDRALGFTDPVSGKYYPPDPNAIHLLLKNLDKEWKSDDQTTIELKREKLEIEKQKGVIW